METLCPCCFGGAKKDEVIVEKITNASEDVERKAPEIALVVTETSLSKKHIDDGGAQLVIIFPSEVRYDFLLIRN